MDRVTLHHAETDQTAEVHPDTVPHMLPNGWARLDGTGDAPEPEPFDPDTHTVAEVLRHLAYCDAEERDRVLDAELDGKARAGIVGA